VMHGQSSPREPARTGYEQDVVSRRARRIYCYTKRPGVCAYAKRSIRRRERHQRMRDGYDGF
jgi:hypothetical protein